MIETIAGLPPGVLGVRASGRVSADDYRRVLIPAVEEVFQQQQRLRVIYQVGPDFEAFEPGAMWEDSMLGMRHLFDWERVAVVTDLAWLRHATAMFAIMMPARVRVFGNDAFAEAVDWLVA